MKNWIKKHDRALKIAITGIALVVAIVVVRAELEAQRQSDIASAESTQAFEQDMAANKPFYDCLIAAAAMADESSSEEEALAAIEAGDECYERF